MKKSVPKGYKTLEVRRWNRILVSAVPETRYAVNTAASYAATPPTGGYIMDEGSNPISSDPLPVAAATNFTIDQLTATPAQYGAYYPGTEVLLQTSYDSVRAEVGDLLGQHSGEVLDRVCRNQIISYIAASGTTIFAGAATSEATIATTHLPTFAEFVEAVKILYRNEAEPCRNGRFCAIISPETWASVMLDATFQNAVIHGGKDTMFTGGWVGTLPWVGIDFYLVKGDGAKRENGALVGTNGVHNTLIFGADAYAVLDWASDEPRDDLERAGFVRHQRPVQHALDAGLEGGPRRPRPERRLDGQPQARGRHPVSTSIGDPFDLASTPSHRHRRGVALGWAGAPAHRRVVAGAEPPADREADGRTGRAGRPAVRPQGGAPGAVRDRGRGAGVP